MRQDGVGQGDDAGAPPRSAPDDAADEAAAGLEGLQLREDAGASAGEVVPAGAGAGAGGWAVEKWYGTVFHEREVGAALRAESGDWFSHLTGSCRSRAPSALDPSLSS